MLDAQSFPAAYSDTFRQRWDFMHVLFERQAVAGYLTVFQFHTYILRYRNVTRLHLISRNYLLMKLKGRMGKGDTDMENSPNKAV